MLYGHVDVVTTANQSWTHPPFEGRVVDGYVWGRGALDMKGGVAMMLAAFLRAKAEELVPAGDIVLVVVSDEEAGGEYGARYLVENHAEQFAGIRYALGEFGGFSIRIGPKTFYPIQVVYNLNNCLNCCSPPGSTSSIETRISPQAFLSHLRSASSVALLAANCVR